MAQLAVLALQGHAVLDPAQHDLELAEAERLFWRDSWWFRVFPFLTSSVMLWAGILLLAVYARRRRAARRAAQRRQWEDEEKELVDAAP